MHFCDGNRTGGSRNVPKPDVFGWSATELKESYSRVDVQNLKRSISWLETFRNSTQNIKLWTKSIPKRSNWFNDGFRRWNPTGWRRFHWFWFFYGFLNMDVSKERKTTGSKWLRTNKCVWFQGSLFYFNGKCWTLLDSSKFWEPWHAHNSLAKSKCQRNGPYNSNQMDRINGSKIYDWICQLSVWSITK